GLAGSRWSADASSAHRRQPNQTRHLQSTASPVERLGHAVTRFVWSRGYAVRLVTRLRGLAGTRWSADASSAHWQPNQTRHLQSTASPMERPGHAGTRARGGVRTPRPNTFSLTRHDTFRAPRARVPASPRNPSTASPRTREPA